MLLFPNCNGALALAPSEDDAGSYPEAALPLKVNFNLLLSALALAESLLPAPIPLPPPMPLALI